MFKMIRDESGQLFAIVLIVTTIVLLTTLVLIAGSQLYFQNSAYAAESEKATALAEAGIDKAIASFNKLGEGYSGDSEIFLGDGSFSVVITSKSAGVKVIESSGFIPSKVNSRIKRTVKVEVSQGVGVAFVYGIQVGEGGLDLNSNNKVFGSVYSNGKVYANSNNEITGDVWVAAAAPATANQETDCADVNCVDFIFGKDVEGEQRLDVAQSFKPSVDDTLNKASLKIKKVGTPTDATVRILEDKQGKPDKTKVIATGTLYSNLVTGSYSFVDITFDTTVTLNNDKVYWLMIDTSANSSNYWSWQNNLAQSYTRGVPAWSPDWKTGNPTWNIFLGDLSFKLYLGGTINALEGNSGFIVGGDAHANTIKKVNIQKDAYYQTIIDSQVLGNSFPGSADPPPKTFPLSEGNITEWKKQAESAGVLVGDLNIDQDDCPLTLDSKKIIGNVFVNGNCALTVKTPIWITGNLTFNSNNTVKLHLDYGSLSGIIIVDGVVEVNSNNQLTGTGIGNSILMVLSTYDSRLNDIPAIKVVSNGSTGAFYAHKGIIEPGSNNDFVELTAWKIRLVSNSTISYETGLSSTMFSSGPTGSYSLVKGSYQIK